MMIIITIWFLSLTIYYLMVIMFDVAVVIPRLLLYTIALPVMPFVVAYRNREEHPTQAKIIYWLWGIIYGLLGLFCLIWTLV